MTMTLPRTRGDIIVRDRFAEIAVANGWRIAARTDGHSRATLSARLANTTIEITFGGDNADHVRFVVIHEGPASPARMGAIRRLFLLGTEC